MLIETDRPASPRRLSSALRKRCGFGLLTQVVAEQRFFRMGEHDAIVAIQHQLFTFGDQ